MKEVTDVSGPVGDGGVKVYKQPQAICILEYSSPFQGSVDLRWRCKDGDVMMHRFVLESNSDYNFEEWYRFKRGQEMNVEENYPLASVVVEEYTCREIEAMLEILYRYQIPKVPDRGPFTSKPYDWPKIRNMIADLGLSVLLPLLDNHIKESILQETVSSSATTSEVLTSQIRQFVLDTNINHEDSSEYGPSNQISASHYVNAEAVGNSNEAIDFEKMFGQGEMVVKPASIQNNSFVLAEKQFIASEFPNRTSPFAESSQSRRTAENTHGEVIPKRRGMAMGETIVEQPENMDLRSTITSLEVPSDTVVAPILPENNDVDMHDEVNIFKKSVESHCQSSVPPASAITLSVISDETAPLKTDAEIPAKNFCPTTTTSTSGKMIPEIVFISSSSDEEDDDQMKLWLKYSALQKKYGRKPELYIKFRENQEYDTNLNLKKESQELKECLKELKNEKPPENLTIARLERIEHIIRSEERSTDLKKTSPRKSATASNQFDRLSYKRLHSSPKDKQLTDNKPGPKSKTLLLSMCKESSFETSRQSGPNFWKEKKTVTPATIHANGNGENVTCQTNLESEPDDASQRTNLRNETLSTSEIGHQLTQTKTNIKITASELESSKKDLYAEKPKEKEPDVNDDQRRSKRPKINQTIGSSVFSQREYSDYHGIDRRSRTPPRKVMRSVVSTFLSRSRSSGRIVTTREEPETSRKVQCQFCKLSFPGQVMKSHNTKCPLRQTVEAKNRQEAMSAKKK